MRPIARVKAGAGGGGGGGEDVMQTRQLSRKQNEINRRYLAGQKKSDGGIRGPVGGRHWKPSPRYRTICAARRTMRSPFMRFQVGFSSEAMKMVETLEIGACPDGGCF